MGLKKIFKNLNFSLGPVPSVRIIAFLSLYFGIALNFSFWHYVFENITLAGFPSYLFLFSVPVLLFAILYISFSLLFLPYFGKPFFAVLLIVSAAVNYLTYRFGVFIDVEMIRNTFETNIGEVKDLITLRSVFWVLITGVLPALVLLKTKVVYNSFFKEAARRLGRCGILLLCLLLLVPFVYKSYASFLRNHREIRRLAVPFNYIYSTGRYFQAEHKQKKPFVKLDEAAKREPNNADNKTVFVFVLGETARAMNFSLNGYERQTNPNLAKEDIVNFKKVEASGTSTAVSVPSIFSFSARKNFDVAEAKNTENILDLLQQTGYKVYWLENDNGCKGVCSRVPNKELKHDNKKYCDGSYCKDGLLLEELEEYLKNLDDNAFIVLHTIGSHGPTYYRRYPEEFKKFTPSCDTEEISSCTREQIINTYDNTILYTDYIVSSVINMLKKHPEWESGMLYVSDHGESLGENGLYLHSVPYAIAPKEQISVPMVLWLNELLRKSDHIDYDCLKKKAAQEQFSHDNLSHSLLKLMEVESKVYDKTLDLFESCRVAGNTSK